jgi:prepilin-type N-terminal cleavage/methylation domain-containing protein
LSEYQAPRSSARQTGFTLVELLIVIAVIAIIAAIALPNMLSSKLVARESAAVATLRAIFSAEAAFKARGAVDTGNSNGAGEFGYLAELAGTVNLRGGVRPLAPPAASGKMGIVQMGIVTTGGYHFAIYLPGPNGVGIAEDANGGKAAVGSLDPDLAEQFFVCYAWPDQRAVSGNRAFVINQVGDVLVTDNDIPGQLYSGTTAMPAFDAAYTAAGDLRVPMATNGLGMDGGTGHAPSAPSVGADFVLPSISPSMRSAFSRSARGKAPVRSSRIFSRSARI